VKCGVTLDTVRIELYRDEYRDRWNEFVAKSKNGVFLFERDYMEYHSDRFPDHSLLIYDGDTLVALLPASRRGEELSSHAGLTFGGFVSNVRMRQALMLEIMETTIDELARAGLTRFVYKPSPHIYHSIPAEEDLYALSKHGALLARRTASSAIRMAKRPRLSKGRKWSTKRGEAAGLEVRRTTEFAAFMEIEEAHLRERFGVSPTHTAAELELLAGRFPDEIQLFGAYRAGELLGGVVVYESTNVAHAQYIAASSEGRAVGALDVVLGHLLDERYAEKRYFDFGISTDHSGREVNIGLVQNKEGFGGRTVVYDTYELELG
jgi:hypothetical protein